MLTCGQDVKKPKKSKKKMVGEEAIYGHKPGENPNQNVPENVPVDTANPEQPLPINGQEIEDNLPAKPPNGDANQPAPISENVATNDAVALANVQDSAKRKIAVAKKTKSVGEEAIYGYLPGENPNENIYRNIRRRDSTPKPPAPCKPQTTPCKPREEENTTSKPPEEETTTSKPPKKYTSWLDNFHPDPHGEHVKPHDPPEYPSEPLKEIPEKSEASSDNSNHNSKPIEGETCTHANCESKIEIKVKHKRKEEKKRNEEKNESIHHEVRSSHKGKSHSENHPHGSEHIHTNHSHRDDEMTVKHSPPKTTLHVYHVDTPTDDQKTHFHLIQNLIYKHKHQGHRSILKDDEINENSG